MQRKISSQKPFKNIAQIINLLGRNLFRIASRYFSIAIGVLNTKQKTHKYPSYVVCSHAEDVVWYKTNASLVSNNIK